MEAMKRYSVIDHTADIGLEASGESIEEAFENTAFGMFDILSDGSGIDLARSLDVMVEADDIEELLVNFLTELLYLYDVEGLLFCDFSVRIMESSGTWELKGVAGGETFDREKHNYPLEIKAVTYHMLEVKRDPPFIRVIFDL